MVILGEVDHPDGDRGAPLITSYDPTKQDLLHTPGPRLGSRAPAGHGRAGARRLVAAGLWRARTDLRVAFPGRAAPVHHRHDARADRRLLRPGAFDTLVNWLVSVVVAFPFYVLIIAIVFAIGPGSRGIYIAITIVGWVSYTRIIRAEVFSQKRREYVLAARAGGLSTPRILVRHLLPNVVTQAVVFACSDIVLDTPRHRHARLPRPGHPAADARLGAA